MGLFEKLVSTVINVATAPVAIAKDVATLGGAMTGRRETYTGELLNTIKRDAQ